MFSQMTVSYTRQLQLLQMKSQQQCNPSSAAGHPAARQRLLLVRSRPCWLLQMHVMME
jgi:hypothetical protein